MRALGFYRPRQKDPRSLLVPRFVVLGVYTISCGSDMDHASPHLTFFLLIHRRRIPYAMSSQAENTCYQHYAHLRVQDAGGRSRRAEAVLLDRISSECCFPRGENSTATLLPLLAEHLELDLMKVDPRTWEAVKAVFGRAQPWAVSHTIGKEPPNTEIISVYTMTSAVKPKGELISNFSSVALSDRFFS